MSASQMFAVFHFLPTFTHDFKFSLKAQTKVRKKVMGVLDIYGFEIFEVRNLKYLSYHKMRAFEIHAYTL